ncbi:MAG: hypothetical protein GY906_23130 [bacterium]|nr:hypothetical protein [bacterium]
MNHLRAIEALNRRLYETRVPHEYRDEGATGIFQHMTRCRPAEAEGAYGDGMIRQGVVESSLDNITQLGDNGGRVQPTFED